MKIGIITYYDTPCNYGQVLQGFATEHILKNLGHEPFIIQFGREDNNTADIDPWNKKIMRVLKGERTIVSIMRRKLSTKQEEVDRGFQEFKQQHMTYSTAYYPDFDSLKENVPEADCYVTGSDQVWASWGAIKTHRAFLLDFLPPGTPRFSFSSSFCRSSMSTEHQELFKKCLAKYLAISVREKDGVNLCKSLGFEAEHIIDPTLLLAKEQWQQTLPFMTKRKSSNQKLVLFYIVTFDSNLKYIYRLMKKFQKQGYKVVYVHSYNYLDSHRTCDPTILDWLSYICTADLVITNSFHGFAFSMNFNTPFVALSKSKTIDIEGQDSRIFSVLREANLEERLMPTGDIQHVITHAFDAIDWNYTNSYFEKERSKAKQYVQHVLEFILGQ